MSVCRQHKIMVTDSTEKGETMWDSTWCPFPGDPAITRRYLDVLCEIKNYFMYGDDSLKFYSLKRINSFSMKKPRKANENM